MKFVLLLCVALLGLGCLTVKAQEFPDPITIEFGEEVSGDGLRNLYYGESVATATPSDHTVTIVWDDLLINRIRVYAYAENAEFDYTGLPGDSGTITVTSRNVLKLEVSAHMYGLP